MATSKLTDLDFDAWSEDDEEKAIEAAAHLSKIRYVISEASIFCGRFPDGRVIKTPLRITVDTLEQLAAAEVTELEQVKMLLGMLGQDDDVDYLKTADLLSAIDYAAKYFRIFEKVTQMSMGEFMR